MIGEHSAAVTLLSYALPRARSSRVTQRIVDALLSLALAYESLRQKHEAIEAAEEVIKISPNNSADYLQAKAIVAGFGDDERQRIQQLKRLQGRAANHRHYTVADNISIELASAANDPEEKLKHLALVHSRREREYNYVRATVRRVETLLQAGRLSEISELDQRDLLQSYWLAYTQRMSGIFNWCHRVIWEYLDAVGDRDQQRELFRHSSFLAP